MVAISAGQGLRRRMLTLGLGRGGYLRRRRRPSSYRGRIRGGVGAVSWGPCAITRQPEGLRLELDCHAALIVVDDLRRTPSPNAPPFHRLVKERRATHLRICARDLPTVPANCPRDLPSAAHLKAAARSIMHSSHFCANCPERDVSRARSGPSPPSSQPGWIRKPYSRPKTRHPK